MAVGTVSSWRQNPPAVQRVLRAGLRTQPVEFVDWPRFRPIPDFLLIACRGKLPIRGRIAGIRAAICDGDGMSPAKVATVLLIAGSLGACAATPEAGQGAKENTGTAVGAIAGGLLGSTIGGNVATKLAAGVAGAAIGGLIGNRIGASMDEEDKVRGAGELEKSGHRPLRHDRSGPGLPAGQRHLPAIHPHDLHRRTAANRAWGRLPQSGWHLDPDQLTTRTAIMSRAGLLRAIEGRDVTPLSPGAPLRPAGGSPVSARRDKIRR
jgi:hypothetical protein